MTASTIQEVRALLLQFERSPLRDLYWRGSEWSVFLAREGGMANPMLAVVATELAVAAAPPSVSVPAPHLGLFEPACAIGQQIERGGLIGRIDVLGRKTEVMSREAGRVAAIASPAAGLVEFGDCLVEITVAA